MGMSQEEIEKLKAEDETSGSVDAASHQELVRRVSNLYVQSVENIIPILVGTDKISLEAREPAKLKLSELSAAIQDDAVFFVFKQPALSGAHWVGYLGKPLALEISKKMMNQEEGDELSEALTSALVEGFNNVLGAYDNSLKEEFGDPVEHSDLSFPGGTGLDSVVSEAGFDQATETWAVPVSVSFDDVKGNMGLILVSQCIADIAEKHPVANTAAAPATPSLETPDEEPAMAASAEPTAADSPVTPAAATGENVARAQFEPLEPRQTAGAPKGIELILDVPLSVTVELGRKKLSVREILELNPGSLVELEKLAGEAVDLLVNGKLFAKGEVVVIDENFGVRVSSIVTPKERLERIGP